MEKKERKTCIVCNRRRYIENMVEITIVAYLKNTGIPVIQKNKWACKECNKN